MSDSMTCPKCDEKDWAELTTVVLTSPTAVQLQSNGLIQLVHEGMPTFGDESITIVGLECVSCGFRVEGDVQKLTKEEVEAAMFPVPDLEALLALRERLQR